MHKTQTKPDFCQMGKGVTCYACDVEECEQRPLNQSEAPPRIIPKVIYKQPRFPTSDAKSFWDEDTQIMGTGY